MTRLARWRGSLTIGDGWAILEGETGENAPHAHLAHQFTAGTDGAIVIGSDGQSLAVEQRRYAAITPAHSHAILPVGCRIRSVYLDAVRMGFGRVQLPSGVSMLAASASAALARCESNTALRTWAQAVFSVTARPGRRFGPLYAALDLETAAVSPRAIAEILGVSPSRLRQISIAAYGAPIARVLQWRQVQRAARALARSGNLADAAAAGGFADQAHFSRRMRRWFGVAPGAGLADLDIRIADSSNE